MEKQIQAVQKFDDNAMIVSEYTYNFGQGRFVFDFKNVTPQFGPGGQGMQFMIAHKVVIMEPHMVKHLAEQLQKAIKDYEKKHGEIIQPEVPAEPEVTTTKPSYYG